MTARKINAMHILFGTADGQCKDCPHFVEGIYHDKKLFKCKVYGMTHSEATGWRKKWVCCGMRDNPHYDGEAVIDRLKHERVRIVEQCAGQIRMEI